MNAPLAPPTGRFARVTTSGRFLPEIDGLRFVAVVPVVFFHSRGHFFPPDPATSPAPYSWIGTLAAIGWFGVPLFFAISGFLLGLPSAEHRLRGGKPVRPGAAIVRRLVRLQPPYVVCLLLLAAQWIFANGGSVAEVLPHLLAGLVHVHWFVFETFNPINPVAWTLEIEIQFTLVAPLLTLVYAVRSAALRRGIFVAAIALGAAWKVFLFDEYVFRTILGQLPFFLVGMLLADFHVTGAASPRAPSWRWDVVGLLAFGAMPACLLASGAWDMCIPWAILLAYLGALRGRLLPACFRLRLLVAVGGIGYTVYLFHLTLIWQVKQVLEAVAGGEIVPAATAANLGWWILDVGLIFAACAVLYLLVEKPFMRRDWPARWWARLSGRPLPTA